MGLIKETNAQYYAGQQGFSGLTTNTITWTGNVDLVINSSTTNTNFSLLKNCHS